MPTEREWVCSVCNRPGTRTGKQELRPYGEGGALICYECATSDPEREAEAERQLEAVFGEHERQGMDTLVQAGHGPLPMIPNRRIRNGAKND